MEFQTLKVSVTNHIAHIELNRPDKANAMDMVMWREIGKAFDWADGEADVRVVVLSGNGKHFTAGIDLMALMGVKEMIKDECEGRSREKLRRLILQMQDDLSALERCRKPVLAAIHNGCIGGGVDLV
jgi:enoyl-CoA hydratase